LICNNTILSNRPDSSGDERPKRPFYYAVGLPDGFGANCTPRIDALREGYPAITQRKCAERDRLRTVRTRCLLGRKAEKIGSPGVLLTIRVMDGARFKTVGCLLTLDRTATSDIAEAVTANRSTAF
jgi:hypothetical protein